MNNDLLSIKDRLSKVESILSQLNIEEEILTVNDLAVLLKVSIPTIYYKTSKKLLPYCKRGNKIFFLKSEIINFWKSVV